jgi:hypothetical protein
MQISGETVVATSGNEDWDFLALPGVLRDEIAHERDLGIRAAWSSSMCAR